MTEQLACVDLVGMTISAELLEAPCTLPDGTDFFGGVGTAECSDGAMVWNDSAWGYVIEPLQDPDTWPGSIASSDTEPNGMDQAGCD